MCLTLQLCQHRILCRIHSIRARDYKQTVHRMCIYLHLTDILYLITNPWKSAGTQSIARNILDLIGNWSTLSVGTGISFRRHRWTIRTYSTTFNNVLLAMHAMPTGLHTQETSKPTKLHAQNHRDKNIILGKTCSPQHPLDTIVNSKSERCESDDP